VIAEDVGTGTCSLVLLCMFSLTPLRALPPEIKVLSRTFTRKYSYGEGSAGTLLMRELQH